ncbi:MAG: hypothetical protein ACMG6E_03530 [Candidatus Roizmanbacteria bacterium]
MFCQKTLSRLLKRSKHMRILTGVGLLADLAFKRLPVVRREVDALLHLLLDVQPAPQTVEVDEAHGAGALAGREEGV